MSTNPEGLHEVTHEAANPMDVDVPKRTCLQTEEFDLLDDDDNTIGTEDGVCGLELVHEKHGEEIVYMCTEHGWQATVFEERGGE